MSETKKDFFTALYQVAKVVNASLAAERVLEEIAACVADTMAVKACSLRILESRGKKLLMGAQVGLSDGYIRKGPVLVQKSRLDKKALKGETIYLKNAQTDDDFQYKDKARAEGIKSLLVVPLVVEKKAVGVLRVYTEKIRKFSADEIKFMEAVANLSAIALENARLHQALRRDYDLMVAHKYRLDDN
ncbi:MAG: GAF domain-containing protein [Desulfobacterales bacterium]|nr:GAF domain-containing protein [Desulfobacterales bacterium]